MQLFETTHGQARFSRAGLRSLHVRADCLIDFPSRGSNTTKHDEQIVDSVTRARRHVLSLGAPTVPHSALPRSSAAGLTNVTLLVSTGDHV